MDIIWDMLTGAKLILYLPELLRWRSIWFVMWIRIIRKLNLTQSG